MDETLDFRRSLKRSVLGGKAGRSSGGLGAKASKGFNGEDLLIEDQAELARGLVCDRFEVRQGFD